MQLRQARRCPPALLRLPSTLTLLPLLVLLPALLFLPPARTVPLHHSTEHTPLAVALSESLLAPRPARDPSQEPRLPINIDTIKKIAQILIMLGEQVVPGAPGAAAADPVPNDPVENL